MSVTRPIGGPVERLGAVVRETDGQPADATWPRPPAVKPDTFGRPLRALDVTGFQLRDAVYDPAQEIPRHASSWARLCLALEGGYVEDWGRIRLRCGPGSLVFHPPNDGYGARISDAGSRCFTVAVAPEPFAAAAEVAPAFERAATPRSLAASWQVFRLREELELRDELSAASVESAVLALLADLAEAPALQPWKMPPRWLERVRERIHDEFSRSLTLGALADTAGVHRVHLARAFRSHYGCTIGQYTRQRRVEYASHRLAASGDPLSEIALGAGFADQSHLTHTFRRLVGMTPAAFRSRFKLRRGSASSRR